MENNNRTNRMLTDIFGAILLGLSICASIFYIWTVVLIVAIIGVVTYLIMFKAVKMNGTGSGIAFLIYVHSTWVFLGTILLLVMGSGVTAADVVLTYPNIILLFAEIAFATVFYIKKQRGWIIGIIIIEAILIVITTISVFVSASDTLKYLSVNILHVVWRIFILVLAIRVLTQMTGFKAIQEHSAPVKINKPENIVALDHNAINNAQSSSESQTIRFCNRCGFQLLPGSDFCSKCGTPVMNKSICFKCGKELPDNAVFCHYCGTKVK